MMAGPVLLDATVLTNFALVSQTDLPELLWPNAVCTAPAAWDEYEAGVARGLLPAAAWAALPLVALTDDETLFAARLSPRLGAGERSCLAAAFCRRGLLATDDFDARRVAQAHQVATTGSLGILILGIEQRRLSLARANHLLVDMIEAGFRAPVDRLDQYVKP